MTYPSVAVLFPGSGRNSRIDGIEEGTTPKDFFYGYTRLREHGYPAVMVDSWRDPAELSARIILRIEYYRSRLMGLGMNTQRVRAIADELAGKDVAVSFTDAFSLSLGYYRDHLHQRPVLAGGFHGLADMEDFVQTGFKALAHGMIKRALDNLDHIFFFGPADRTRSIRMYDIPESKTSLFPFGVDLEFWRPTDHAPDGGGVFSVGSDPKRDYPTLLRARFPGKIRILTRLKIDIGDRGTDIEVLRGSLHGSAITDEVLRGLYQSSEIVVVPLLDVWQPTGYSVTLQAMACGKPVVLSDIRGLWDRDVFRSGENCILVRPGDAHALGAAIRMLQGNPDQRRQIGASARRTAEQYFSLARMEDALESMVNMLGSQRSIST